MDKQHRSYADEANARNRWITIEVKENLISKSQTDFEFVFQVPGYMVNVGGFYFGAWPEEAKRAKLMREGYISPTNRKFTITVGAEEIARYPEFKSARRIACEILLKKHRSEIAHIPKHHNIINDALSALSNYMDRFR